MNIKRLILNPLRENTYIAWDDTKECIIIDSITHEWSGVGGCLEMQQIATDKQRVKNSYTAWKEITPLHQKFVDAILQSKCHIITTVRSKTDYLQTDIDGKKSIQKVGMAQVTRDGFEYELTISLELDVNHRAIVSKDRTNLFEGLPAFIPSEDTGRKIKDWCENGTDLKAELMSAIAECKATTDVDALAVKYASLKVVDATTGKSGFPEDIRKALREKYDSLNK